MDYYLPYVQAPKVVHNFQVSILLDEAHIQDVFLNRNESSWKVGFVAFGLFACFHLFPVLCL